MSNFQRFVREEPFRFPEHLDLIGILFFSLSGALAAMRRGYDLVGVFILALVVGAGGGLIRDGLFLQQGPPALTQDWRFLPAVALACFVAWLINFWIVRFRRAIAVLDAVGLSLYSMLGLVKSLETGLSIPAAILVGVINAAGGGLLRDILTQNEPLLFKPGQFYVVASLVGCLCFVIIGMTGSIAARPAVQISTGIIFIIRILAIVLNWRTAPIKPWSTPPKWLSRKSSSTEHPT